MRKIVLYMMSTLDGRGADPGNEMYWAKVTEQTWEFVAEMREKCDAALLGGNLYREFLDYWPAVAEDESNAPDLLTLARWMAASEKFVLSASQLEPDPRWPHTTLLRDVAAVKAIKDTPGADILLLGGIGVVDVLAENDLIDEYWIHLNPCAIGEGPLLLNRRLDLELLEARPFDSGVVVLHYGRT